MEVQRILTANWSDYEAKKLESQQDPMLFCANQPWELNYLIRKIRETLPQYTETVIFLAIRSAIRALQSHVRRGAFIEYTVRDLLKRQPFSSL